MSFSVARWCAPRRAALGVSVSHVTRASRSTFSRRWGPNVRRALFVRAAPPPLPPPRCCSYARTLSVDWRPRSYGAREADRGRRRLLRQFAGARAPPASPLALATRHDSLPAPACPQAKLPHTLTARYFTLVLVVALLAASLAARVARFFEVCVAGLQRAILPPTSLPALRTANASRGRNPRAPSLRNAATTAPRPSSSCTTPHRPTAGARPATCVSSQRSTRRADAPMRRRGTWCWRLTRSARWPVCACGPWCADACPGRRSLCWAPAPSSATSRGTSWFCWRSARSARCPSGSASLRVRTVRRARVRRPPSPVLCPGRAVANLTVVALLPTRSLPLYALMGTSHLRAVRGGAPLAGLVC
jgi:hypothetical protein